MACLRTVVLGWLLIVSCKAAIADLSLTSPIDFMARSIRVGLLSVSRTIEER